MSLANKRKREFVDGVEVSYRQWPADIDGNIEEGVLTETAPATYDEDFNELTPAVVEMVVSTRPLTQPERDEWVAAEDDDSRNADKKTLKDDLETLKTLRDDAAQQRDEMDWYSDPANPERLNKWKPVDEARDVPFPDHTVDLAAWVADVEARVDDQAKLLNLIVKDARRAYGDQRQIEGTLIRKLRADRDDA